MPKAGLVERELLAVPLLLVSKEPYRFLSVGQSQEKRFEHQLIPGRPLPRGPRHPPMRCISAQVRNGVHLFRGPIYLLDALMRDHARGLQTCQLRIDVAAVGVPEEADRLLEVSSEIVSGK